MTTAVRQNVAIMPNIHKRVKVFCSRREIKIRETVGRWCSEGMKSDIAKEKQEKGEAK